MYCDADEDDDEVDDDEEEDDDEEDDNEKMIFYKKSFFPFFPLHFLLFLYTKLFFDWSSKNSDVSSLAALEL